MDITAPIFTDADKAREHLESIRWANGRFCPHCGEAENTTPLKGKAHRPGLFQCNACRKQFSVTVGTVYERSKIPLNKWVLATHLVASSKKGISAHQLHRMLGITYKSAWFMAHRIREAMRSDGPLDPVGGDGEVALSGRVRFPLQRAHCPWRERRRAPRQGPCWHRRQAPHLSAD